MRLFLRLETGSHDDVMQVLKRAAKPLIDTPPMKTDATGRRVIDEDAFKEQLKTVLGDAVQTIVEVSKANPARRTRFDAAVRDAMFATLYGPDGKRNKEEVSAMGSIADIRFNKVMPKSDKHLPKGGSRDEYAALARKLINECGEDPDMLDAIEFNASRFLVRGDSKLRTPEEIVNRVAAYRSTLHEMLAIGESNPPMRAVMKKLSTSFSGLALPKGMIAKVIEKAEAVDLTPFENLGKTSNSLAIHNAVMALNKAVNNITKETGAKDKLDGPDEHKPFCMFVECAILTRLPKASLRGISAALSTPIAAKLSDFYDAFSSGRNNLSEKSNLSKGVQVEIKHELNLLNGVIHELKENAERALGHETFTSINLEDAQTVSDDDLDAGSILANVRDESKLILAEKREAFLADVVKGKGKVAAKIRGLFADMIGPMPFDPAYVAFKKINKNAEHMTNYNIMRFAKAVMDGDLRDTMLFKDANRRIKVTLKGVGTLSTDFNEALDQIACFVTGKKDAKFETLDDASKRKAAIVIGFLGQESDKAVVDGCAHALDPKGDASAVNFGGSQHNDEKVYELEFSDGQLRMKLNLVEHRTSAVFKDMDLEAEGGITVSAGIDYCIPAHEMDRLSKLDLASYDETEATKELTCADDKLVNENHIDKMYDKIPNDYKITARCVTYYDVDVKD